MLLKLNYGSEYFIQNNPEVKNKPHSLFLQEISTGTVETVKLCIGLSLLLANLYLQVVSFFLKSCLFLQLHTSNFAVTRFLTVR